MFTNVRPVWYMQTDPRWANWPYSNKNEKTTIGRSGCGPSSMSMVIAQWCDPNFTPLEACKWALEHGYKATGAGTYHSYFVPQAKAFGLQCEKLNKASLHTMGKEQRRAYDLQAQAYVADGNMVIALMGPGLWTSGGHYVLWYSNSADGKMVYINDPASKKEARHINTFELFTSQARYYWVIHVPKEVISMTNTEVVALIESKIASFKSTDPNPSTWAKDAWYSACQAGIFDKSSPRGNMTREQAASIMQRLKAFDALKTPENFDFSKWAQVDPSTVTKPEEKPAEPETPAPTIPDEPKYETYTVVAGDSFWNIAKKVYGDGTKYTKILADNGMTASTVIHPGDVLKIYK